MLDVTDVSVWLDGQKVLRDVSLRVEAGATCALLGPSGCGKSTLLRSIAGLTAPQAGRVYLAGADQSGVPAEKRAVGLMFQDHALFPHLSVAGNVAFGLKMQGMAAHDRDVRVNEVLHLVGLADLAHRRVASLSGGERQRVALARTLAPKPQLLLLDEPLGALDRRLRDRLLDELPEIFAAEHTTVVYVTHDYSEAERLASQIAVMDAGQIDRHDTPARLWRDPQTVFTARFIDAGPVWAGEDAGVVETPFGRLGDSSARGVLLPSAALCVGSVAMPGQIVAQAQVKRVVFQNGVRHLRVQFADGASATIGCEDRQAHVGDTVTVSCDKTQVTVLHR